VKNYFSCIFQFVEKQLNRLTLIEWT